MIARTFRFAFSRRKSFPSSGRLNHIVQRAIAAAALCELSDASARKLKPRPLVESKSNVPYGVAHNTEANGSTIIGAESSVCSSKDRETAVHRPRTAYADLSDLDKLTVGLTAFWPDTT